MKKMIVLLSILLLVSCEVSRTFVIVGKVKNIKPSGWTYTTDSICILKDIKDGTTRNSSDFGKIGDTIKLDAGH